MKKAACVLLLNEEGKILGVSRKDDIFDFGLPGGKVDPGETEEAAAIREVKEETGLVISNLKKVWEGECLGEVDYWTTTFTADWSGTIKTNEKGVVEWIDLVDLITGCFGDYNKRLFEVMGWGAWFGD